MIKKTFLVGFVFSALAILSACAPVQSSGSTLQVVATTPIVGDVVAAIGGQNIALTILLPPGADPHSFQPTPKDLVAVEKANLVFVNGFDLEEFLSDLLEQTEVQSKVVVVSEGIMELHLDEVSHEDDEEEHESGIDPHVWMAPLNVSIWAENIAAALSGLDHEHAAEYQANAHAYQSQLQALHTWMLEQFVAIPESNRLLVSDHQIFGYLAQTYGFEVVGTLTGFSSLSESSAQELAVLEETIRIYHVPAIFVSTTVPAALAEQVAQDTGVQLVPVYAGTLSTVEGPAPTYLQMMRHTVSAMVQALQ